MLFKRGVHALEGRFYAFEKGVHMFENNINFILSEGSRFWKGVQAFEKGFIFSNYIMHNM